MEPLLELRNITKYFGNFVANDNINIKIYPGEVHALLGENGAGKSTLMNIIFGLYHADEGQIFVRGKEVHIKSASDAMKLGIGMVHQHYMLVDVFSSAENVFLLSNQANWKTVNHKKIEETLNELGKKFGLEVDVHSRIDKLTVSMQQRVEILKLLYIGADLLILDEPTAVLTPQECDALFVTIENLRKHGKSIIFISHKLDEVLKISQKITVLSHGRVAGEMMTADADKNKIIKMMVNTEIETPTFARGYYDNKNANPVIELQNVTANDDRGVQTLGEISLKLMPGEVIGVAGVEGNGQAELAEVMAGMRKVTGGKIKLFNKEVTAGDCKTFIKNNVGYVPADRNYVGTVKTFPLYENWLLRRAKRPKKFKLLDYYRVKNDVKFFMEKFDVRARGIYDQTGNLSGGNLQKFILAREMSKNPKVLICSYPTRGVDVVASWFVRENIVHARQDGVGVIVISGDFEELFAVSDRLIVMFEGKIIGELNPRETNVHEVGNLMMGIKPSSGAEERNDTNG